MTITAPTENFSFAPRMNKGGFLEVCIRSRAWLAGYVIALLNGKFRAVFSYPENGYVCPDQEKDERMDFDTKADAERWLLLMGGIWYGQGA